MKAGRVITRIVLAFEAGRDGFWLARWLRARSIETFVIHSTSVAVSREHRRAKTDRLDTEMLIRVFLGWLRGEPRHCKMVAIPSRRCGALSSSGLKPRMPRRISAAFMRLMILVALRTAEEVPIPPNMLDEMRRDQRTAQVINLGHGGHLQRFRITTTVPDLCCRPHSF